MSPDGATKVAMLYWKKKIIIESKLFCNLVSYKRQYRKTMDTHVYKSLVNSFYGFDRHEQLSHRRKKTLENTQRKAYEKTKSENLRKTSNP